MFPGQIEHHILSSSVSVNITSLSTSSWVIKSNEAMSVVIVHKGTSETHRLQHLAHTGVLKASVYWVQCIATAQASAFLRASLVYIKVGSQAKQEAVTKTR